MRRVSHLLVSIITALLVVSLTTVNAQSQNDRAAERLQQLLKRYPDADANGDGALSMQEANAYRKTMARGSANKKKTKEYSIKPGFADVKYGEHERNAIDLWLAKTNDGSPRPLAVHIHGGGFKGGDKSSVSMSAVERFLEAGISVATINYRLTDVGPFPMQMHDGARAIQFLRFNAAKYNIDKSRVATTGGSAGGCMSFWLAFHDDLADKKSKDPIARESTRLTCIAPNAGQSTLDPDVLAEWFACDNLSEHGGARPLFGITEIEEAEKPEVKALIKEASPLTHLTKDDPPVFMTYKSGNVPVDETSPPNLWVHHPIFGIRTKAIMDKMGMENYLMYKGGPEPEKYADGVEFMIAKLTE